MSVQLLSQEFVSIGEDEIKLQNGHLKRILRFEDGSMISTGLYLEGNPQNFIVESADFSCLVNDKVVNGHQPGPL